MAPPRPTHEYNAVYATGEPPPWDIGRPQVTFEELARAGRLHGRVIDVGCGTGEHALLAASVGCAATGVDIAPNAIAIAQQKAHARGLDARFIAHDALNLGALGEQFDIALDCGCFHVFDDDDRARFVDSVHAVIRPGGVYHLLCFSDRQPGDWGPRRVTEAELRASFNDGWRLEAIAPTTLDITIDPSRVFAWHATITRR